MFRGSYNRGFRAPSFNQLFNGVTETQYSGKDLADPKHCGSLKVDSTKPGCEAITPVILTGGKANLGPETSKQANLGVVWEPLSNLSLNADLWEIRKENTIDSFSAQTMINNYGCSRISSCVTHPATWRSSTSAGSTQASASPAAWSWAPAPTASWAAASGPPASTVRACSRRSRAPPRTSLRPSEVGRFTFTGDLGLKWKHTAYVSYKQGDWSGLFQNIYRSGYKDQVLPGVANGVVTPTDYNPDVKAYSIFNLSVNYTGFKNTDPDRRHQEPVRQGSAVRDHLRQQLGRGQHLGAARRRPAWPFVHAAGELQVLLIGISSATARRPGSASPRPTGRFSFEPDTCACRTTAGSAGAVSASWRPRRCCCRHRFPAPPPRVRAPALLP
jgi:hypothetical protein